MAGQVFLAHSRQDVDLRQWVDAAFADSDMKVKRLEFEEEARHNPPIPVLVERMRDSKAVFVLLGPHLVQSRHTIAWVAAETGLARGLDRRVWVFEDSEKPVDVPVPFVDAYVPLAFTDENVMWLKGIIEDYSAWWPGFPPPPLGLAEPLERYGWPLHRCVREGCQADFYAPDSAALGKCPVCTTPQTWPGRGPYREA